VRNDAGLLRRPHRHPSPLPVTFHCATRGAVHTTACGRLPDGNTTCQNTTGDPAVDGLDHASTINVPNIIMKINHEPPSNKTITQDHTGGSRLD
jgi:hypothetical protein